MADKSKKSDLLVMHEMCVSNMDIACAVDQLNLQRDEKRKGGKVTFGVASPQFDYLINQAATGKTTHYAILYIINKEQFDKIKNS